MFEKLFNKLARLEKKRADVIYQEYLPLLRDKLLPLGFNSKEGSGMGICSVFKCENLEIILAYDLRDRITFLDLKSGKKFKSKTTLFDQLPEEIRKEALEMSISKTDISLVLKGTDEEKASTMKSLDNWLTEHR